MEVENVGSGRGGQETGRSIGPHQSQSQGSGIRFNLDFLVINLFDCDGLLAHLMFVGENLSFFRVYTKE